jgi:hypothetical protein
MASINLLQYSYATSHSVNEKGLVLNTKEGFFRDIGTTLFNDSDYVRVGICFSINLQSNPNYNLGMWNEKLTNNLVSNSFFMGLKTPNSNLPSTTTNTTKFAGFWLPPRGQSSNISDYTGFAGASNAFGVFNGANFYQPGLIAGSLNQPFTFTQAQTSVSYNNTSFGIGTRFIGTHYLVDEITGSVGRPNIWGMQLTKNGVASFEYEASGNNLNTGGAYLSALKTFVNNKPFLSNSISLTGGEYGNATSIFVYNPFQTHCIRVHGIIAAGFTS